MLHFNLLLLILILSLISGFSRAAEPATNDPQAVATTNKKVSAEDVVRLTELALTPEQMATRQKEVAASQTALQTECQAFESQLAIIQEQFDLFEFSGTATQDLITEAAKKKEEADAQVEKIRSERQTVQTQLDKRGSYIQELETQLVQLQEIASEKRTEDQNKELQKIESIIPLQKHSVELEQRYLELLKTKSTMAIKNALLATQWHGRLQESYNNQLLKERQQGLSIAEIATAKQEEMLLKAQTDLPALLASLEGGQTTVKTLNDFFENSLVRQESSEIEAKNLKLERQGIEINIERQTKAIENLTKDLDKLRQTPPAEPEQTELQNQRVANFDAHVKSQQKMLDLEKKYLQIISQRITQAEKQLQLATGIQEKIRPILQTRQEQELDVKLQEEQQRYLAQATELRWQLNKIPAEQTIQRYLLEVKIQQANELSQRVMRQREIQIIENQLEKFKKTVSDQEKSQLSASQLKSFQASVDELKAILQRIRDNQDLLKDKLVTIEKQQKTAEKQGKLLAKEQEEAETKIDEKDTLSQKDRDFSQQSPVAERKAAEKQGKSAKERGEAEAKIDKKDTPLQKDKDAWQQIPVAERLKQNEETQNVLATLKSDLQEETDKLPLLLKQGEELLTVLEETYRKSLQRSLSSQRQLPTTLSEWQVLFGEVKVFPQLFLQQLQLFFGDFKQAFQQTGQQQWLIIGIFTLLWLGGIVMARLWGFKQLQKNTLKTKKSSLIANFSLALQLIYMNLWSIAFIVLFLFVSWLTQPNSVTFLGCLSVLAIVLGSKFLLNLSRLLLSSAQSLQVHLKVYRQFRWEVLFLTIFAIVVTLIHQKHAGLTIRLSLTTGDFIDTLFMLSLVIVVWPLWQLRRIILSSMQQTAHNHWLIIVRFVAALLPLSISVVSVLGVIGYMNLSWLIAQQMTLFLLVLTVWLVIRGFLSDFVMFWRNRLAHIEGYGSVWSEDLIPLIHNIVGVMLFAIAVIILLKISGWYSDTAFRQGVVNLWNFSLFTIGNSPIMIGNVLSSIFLLWIILWLGNWSRGISYRWAYAGIADSGVRHSLSVFTHYAIILIGLLIVFRTVGLDPTMLTVFAGAIGVGIGFGMQNVVNNFISGILLLIERPLKTGDVVDIGSFKEVTVGQIGIRSTTVKMPDKKELIVPNSEIISQSFVNWTRGNMLLRIDSYIGVSYDDDLRLVEKILLETMGEINGILRDPPFRILLWEFGESRVIIRIEYHVDMSRGSYERVKSDMKFRMWERFREAGIKIPYPQRDVHLKGQTTLENDLFLTDDEQELKENRIVLPQNEVRR